MKAAAMLAALTVWSAGALAQQAGATAAKAPEKAAACAACHGPDGNSTSGQFPILAGQTSRYIYLQLRDFRDGRRKDPLMSPAIEGLSADDFRALAEWFSQQKPKPNGFKPDAGKARLGKLKADETLCTMCHLGGFAGQNEIPRVAGQQYDYVKKQLSDFKARRRTNDAGSMTSVSNTLSDQDIENLAHYVSGL
jgi:cytochrome c553